MFGKIIAVLACAMLCNVILASEPTVEKFYSVKNSLNASQPRQDSIKYRLPNNTKPLTYDITLSTAVHTGERAFNGSVRIQLVANEPSNKITLHARQMTITSVSMFAVGQLNLLNTTSDFTQDADTEFFEIPLPFTLQMDVFYYLTIEYTGVLRLDQAGFYLSVHRDPQGNEKFVATTQFESTDARHAFPCYDEPGIRAEYTLRLRHHEDFNAISNMPGARSSPDADNMVTTSFRTTPPMQTYLLAFIVSEYTSVSFDQALENREVLQHKVFARPEYLSRGDGAFALAASVDILNEIQKAVGQPYKLPKIDQVAIAEFSAGAMENWGLVTYREAYLLYNRGVQAMTQEKSVTCIIAHEYGHQFFGNWVSPVWWDYLWLNEGFATLFEYYGADAAYPDYRIWDLYQTEIIHYAFNRDDKVDVRAMTYYVESPSDIEKLFDFIAYDKSGAVLRMFMYAFGEETFMKGLKYYLEEMEYKSATSIDLSRALQRAVREDESIPETVNVQDIIHSWSEQAGYPILYVSRNDDGDVTIHQERFLNTEASASEKDKRWWLPFNFAVRANNDADFSNTRPDGWLTSSQTSLVLKPADFDKNWGRNDWLIFNKKQAYYYRVNYDDDMWNMIIRELNNGNFESIHYSSRAQLLEDACKIAMLDRLNFDIVFGLMSYMDKEREYLPWAVFSNNIGDINLYLSGSENYGIFRDYVKEKIEPYYISLGPANKPTDKLYERQGRNIAMQYACSMGSEVCRTETSQKLNMHLTANTEVEIDNRAYLYCSGLRAADSNLFLRAWDKMMASTDETLRSLIISSLGCSESSELLEILLNTTIDGTTTYRTGERGQVMTAVFSNTNIGFETAFRFIQGNILRIHDVYEGTMPLSDIFGTMGQRIVSNEQQARFLALGETHTPTYVSRESVDLAKTRGEANLKFIDAHSEHIIGWIQNYNENGIPGGAATLSFPIVSLLLAAVAFMYV